MATTVTNPHLISLATYATWPAKSVLSTESPVRAAVSTHARRRRMTPEAGRAIEMLGHAIEYLGDEFALDCMTRPKQAETPSTANAINSVNSLNSLNSIDPRIVAIHLLMARNREIYLNCPEVPSLGERVRALFHSPRTRSGRSRG
jgi:hypothetical protein